MMTMNPFKSPSFARCFPLFAVNDTIITITKPLLTSSASAFSLPSFTSSSSSSIKETKQCISSSHTHVVEQKHQIIRDPFSNPIFTEGSSGTSPKYIKHLHNMLYIVKLIIRVVHRMKLYKHLIDYEKDLNLIHLLDFLMLLKNHYTSLWLNIFQIVQKR